MKDCVEIWVFCLKIFSQKIHHLKKQKELTELFLLCEPSVFICMWSRSWCISRTCRIFHYEWFWMQICTAKVQKHFVSSIWVSPRTRWSAALWKQKQANSTRGHYVVSILSEIHTTKMRWNQTSSTSSPPLWRSCVRECRILSVRSATVCY